MSDLVLIESDVSRLFVLLSFRRNFYVAFGVLECPLRISIANKHKVSTTSIFRDCVLNIFRVQFPVNMVPISMGDVCMIVGMDWLG